MISKAGKFRVFLFAMVISGSLLADSHSLARLNQVYGDLLSDHTESGVMEGIPVRKVDYTELRSDERWQALIDLLASVPPSEIETPDQRMAFYLNAYNILAINKVIENWPVRSLRDAGSLINPVWIQDAGTVAGEPLTLEYIEHEILRNLGDPRVHMAINCASISCPDLRFEPYVADRIDEQLEDQVRQFLKPGGKGLEVDEEMRVVRLSAVFDWFEEDFAQAGGVDSFVRTYRDDLPPGWPMKADLYYNWGINGELSAKMLRALREGF